MASVTRQSPSAELLVRAVEAVERSRELCAATRRLIEEMREEIVDGSRQGSPARSGVEQERECIRPRLGHAEGSSGAFVVALTALKSKS